MVTCAKRRVDIKITKMRRNMWDWIYDNIFHLSQDQYDEYRDMTVEDAKREFRMKQIVDEGNDPKVTGKSYGTPHDLALAYGKGRMGSNPENIPDGYGDDLKLGRPEETGTDSIKEQFKGSCSVSYIGEESCEPTNKSPNHNPLTHQISTNQCLVGHQNHLQVSRHY